MHHKLFIIGNGFDLSYGVTVAILFLKDATSEF